MSRLIKFRRDYLLMCTDEYTTLQLANDAIQTHPLFLGHNKFSEASMCRLLIVNRVNMVENLLRFWQQLDQHKILKSYFPPDDNVPNDKRLESLKNAFKFEDFDVKDNIFNKYLALKYLRNFITHGISVWIRKNSLRNRAIQLF